MNDVDTEALYEKLADAATRAAVGMAPIVPLVLLSPAVREKAGEMASEGAAYAGQAAADFAGGMAAGAIENPKSALGWLIIGGAVLAVGAAVWYSPRIGGAIYRSRHGTYTL